MLALQDFCTETRSYLQIGTISQKRILEFFYEILRIQRTKRLEMEIKLEGFTR